MYPEFGLDPWRNISGRETESGLPEACQDCGTELIFTIRGSDPPAAATKCFCGEWLFVICTKNELDEFLR